MSAYLTVNVESMAYRSPAGEEQILDTVHFTARRGEIVALVGPSGCGKTTLLKLIGGLIGPGDKAVRFVGEIEIDGARPNGARGLGRFSFVFQQPVLLPWRSVRENVRLPGELLDIEVGDVDGLLRRVGLSVFDSGGGRGGIRDDGDKYPHQLSGGMAQRAALARALAFDPEVLLLDEPFAAVDEFTREILNSLLIEICRQRNLTAVIATHSLSEAVFLADTVVVLSTRPASIAASLSIEIGDRLAPELRLTEAFNRYVQELRGVLRRGH